MGPPFAKSKRPMKMIYAFMTLFSAMSIAAQNEPCQLKLISNEAPKMDMKSSNEGERFLSFLADMKKLGIRFKGTTQEEVKAEFEALSHENVNRYIKSFSAYMKRASGNDPKVSYRGGTRFKMWRNIGESAQNFGKPKLLSDFHMLKHKIFQRDLSMWSVVQGGLNGVLMNLEITQGPDSQLGGRALGRNEARIDIQKEFQSDWIYGLPLPGSDSIEYVGLDKDFFSFLMVFAPEKLTQFVEDFRVFFPNKLGADDVMDPNSDFTARLHNFSKHIGIVDILKSWSPNFRDLVLNEEDATLLLAFTSVQAYPHNKMTNLTVVIPGDIGPEDYQISGLQGSDGPGGVIRRGPNPSLTKPNMTGDVGPFPSGPNTK